LFAANCIKQKQIMKPWNVILSDVIDKCKHFGRTCCLRFSILKIGETEALSSFYTLVPFYQTTWYHATERISKCQLFEPTIVH